MRKLRSQFIGTLKQDVSNVWTVSTLVCVYLLCLHRLFFKLSVRDSGDWEYPASLYGHLFHWGGLPLELLGDPELVYIYRNAFVVSLIGWLMIKGFRSYFAFGLFLFFTLACSHHIENIPRAESHTGNILSLSLLVFFFGHVWGFTSVRKMRLLDFAKGVTTPYIIPFTIKALLLLVYSISGFYKVYRSGMNWTSSSNIQTYLSYFVAEDRRDWLIHLILNHKNIATLVGVSVLLLECFAAFSLLNRKTSQAYSLLLISFHLSISYYFGWTFYSHSLLLLVVVSPLAYQIMGLGKKEVCF